MPKKRQKYTYVPNREIENIVTTNSSFSGDELLDGVYLRGRRKYKKGGKVAKKMSNRAVANKIMELDAKIWEDLDIQSGSQLREDKELQRKYVDKMAEKADKLMARASNKQMVMDMLEDENYHSSWGYFHSGGKTPYPEFADGGKAPSRKMRSLNSRAQEMVGTDVWDDLSVEAQADLVADYVAEGVLSVPYGDGGHLVRKSGIGSYQPTVRKRGDEYVVYSRTHGVHKFSSKEKADQFVEKVKKDLMKLAATLDEDFYAYEDGGMMAWGGKMEDGGMMAKGAEVADASTYVVSYEMGGKKKEKTFDDMTKAKSYMELLSEEDDITKIQLKEVEAEKKAKAEPVVNLFAKPAAPAASKPKKAKDRGEVIVPGIADAIARYDALKEIIKNAEAEKEILDGQLKEIGKDKFLELYEQEGYRPKNFNLADGDEKILYVMSDNYRGSRYGVSAEKAAMLEPYDDILESETTYTMNNDVLNKPGVGEAISRMIMQSKVLSDEDKSALIIATTKTVVKKGTIDRLLQYDNPAMIFDLIEPVVSLR